MPALKNIPPPFPFSWRFSCSLAVSLACYTESRFAERSPRLEPGGKARHDDSLLVDFMGVVIGALVAAGFLSRLYVGQQFPAQLEVNRLVPQER